MKWLGKTLYIFVLMGAVTGVQAAEVATVNGKSINASLIDLIYKDLVARGEKVDANTKSLIVNKLISSEVVLQDALRQGIDRQPDFAIRKEMMERELLVNAYLESYLVKNPVGESVIKAEYERYKTQLGSVEYSARHILVKSQEEAKAIITELANGADFSKIARDKSQDPGSKGKGGELGWFSPAVMAKPFGEAVSKMQKGEIAKEPVNTQFGWHVIQLNDVRTAEPLPYEKMHDAIRKQLQQRNMEKLVTDLRAKAKIIEGAAK